MHINTRTITTVTVAMTGSECSPDSFDVEWSEDIVEGWAVLMARWGRENKVAAIKHIRKHFNIGLREAKAFVEDSMRNYS